MWVNFAYAFLAWYGDYTYMISAPAMRLVIVLYIESFFAALYHIFVLQLDNKVC